MCEIRDNLEKYDIIELDKRDRKQFTTRNKQLTESDNSTDESEVKETKKGAKQKV